jgi:hypothetical protein
MHPKVSHSLYKKEMLLKHQEQQTRVRCLQERAMDEAKTLSRILVHEFHITRVFLTGPLTYGKFQKGMSLELALEEVPEGTYGKALGHLKRISTFDIELIDLQVADSWTKRSIRETGKLLVAKHE